MNAYFQLFISGQGVSLCAYPATDEGQNLDINEVIFYLQSKGIEFDVVHLNEGIRNIKADKAIIPLSKQILQSVMEMFSIRISPDMMTVTARFYPPSLGGAFLTKEDIINDLNKQKVCFGIDEAVIEAYLSQKRYCTDIVIARGVLPIQGRDASIEYFFNTDLKVRPTLKEDGGVDFFNLNTLNHCKAEDVLAKLHKEDVGQEGKNVLGTVMRPADVKRLTLQFSNHIEISEDKTVLTSKVDGHVCLVEGKVFVSNIYEVKNVDNSTGNIDYEGSLLVSGNICSNFTVKAKGNIEVRGVVEGAYVEAGGDIVIARGMNGMNKGTLKAEGNIIAKFIENASAEAGGYIETDSILHSRVFSRTEINVLSHKGFITGGIVCATNAVNVKNLGSQMGTDTIVEIGVNPETKKRYQELQKEMVEIQKTLAAVEPILRATRQKLLKGEKLTPDRMKYIQTLAIAQQQKQAQLAHDEKEMMLLQAMMDNRTAAQVVVTGTVYSGTKIVISDAALTVPDNMKYCRFIKSQGEVKMTSI